MAQAQYKCKSCHEKYLEPDRLWKKFCSTECKRMGIRRRFKQRPIKPDEVIPPSVTPPPPQEPPAPVVDAEIFEPVVVDYEVLLLEAPKPKKKPPPAPKKITKPKRERDESNDLPHIKRGIYAHLW